MRPHPTRIGFAIADPTLAWAGDLRAAMIADLSPSAIGTTADRAAAGVVLATTTAGLLAVLQGGTTMTSTTIGATVASHTAAKIAAGGLAAALTVGGAAAVTGDLPDGAQRFAADAAARIGLTLPRPQAHFDGSLDLWVGDIVEVGTAGRVGVRLDETGLRLTGIEGNAGFSAHVVAETPEAAIVEFRSATETTSVLLTSADGAIVSSVTTGIEAEAEAGLRIGG